MFFVSLILSRFLPPTLFNGLESPLQCETPPVCEEAFPSLVQLPRSPSNSWILSSLSSIPQHPIRYQKIPQYRLLCQTNMEPYHILTSVELVCPPANGLRLLVNFVTEFLPRLPHYYAGIGFLTICVATIISHFTTDTTTAGQHGAEASERFLQWVDTVSATKPTAKSGWKCPFCHDDIREDTIKLLGCPGQEKHVYHRGCLRKITLHNAREGKDTSCGGCTTLLCQAPTPALAMLLLRVCATTTTVGFLCNAISILTMDNWDLENKGIVKIAFRRAYQIDLVTQCIVVLRLSRLYHDEDYGWWKRTSKLLASSGSVLDPLMEWMLFGYLSLNALAAVEALRGVLVHAALL